MAKGVYGITKPQDAIDVPVDDTNLPEIAPVDEVQAALEKLYTLALSSSRGFIFAQYNGNANSGRYLEFFTGIDSSDAPLFTPTSIEVITIIARTTATDATCTLGFYDTIPVTPVLLYTLTFTAEKRVINIGSPLFTIPAGGRMAVKVDSGSISKPHLYMIARGGS